MYEQLSVICFKIIRGGKVGGIDETTTYWVNVEAG